jgi:hypothetical protein
MAEEVYMDIPAVRGVARQFGLFSQTLTTVSRVLTALSNILKGTAFIGLVGGAAAIFIIDNLNRLIKHWAERCTWLSRELSNSVNAYERGDAQGATLFY